VGKYLVEAERRGPMSFVVDTLKIVGFSLGLVFPIWPVVVLSPLGWRRGNKARGMVIMWFGMFACWFLIKASSAAILELLIPQRMSTLLFFLTGGVLVAWNVVVMSRGRHSLHWTADHARRPQDLLEISPAEFEDMVVGLYRLKGYSATRTGATGDHGVDVIVKTQSGQKWVVQCKRWRGWVGEPVVRDFYGTMQHEKADRGVLVTTGTFSNAAREWAKGKPLGLVDGKEFLRNWREAKRAKA